MLNRVCLVGNLTDNITINKTTTGKEYVNFTLAVNKIGEGVDYIRITAWNKTAVFLSQYAKKGNKLSIDGRIQTSSYDDKTTGKKVYVTDVVADYVDLLTPRDKTETNSNNNCDTSDFQLKPDDLPF